MMNWSLDPGPVDVIAFTGAIFIIVVAWVWGLV